MLRFVLDVGVGNLVYNFLRDAGYDVISILHLDPEMADVDILAIAEREERMVITMDKDFGELVYRSRKQHRGVLLLRLEDATGEEKVKVVEEILAGYAEEIADCFCVYQFGRLRIRR